MTTEEKRAYLLTEFMQMIQYKHVYSAFWMEQFERKLKEASAEWIEGFWKMAILKESTWTSKLMQVSMIAGRYDESHFRR